AGQGEAGMMPMACEDAVLHGAAVQREAHVRAAVVHRIDGLAMGKQGQGVSLDGDGQTAGSPPVRHLATADKVCVTKMPLDHSAGPPNMIRTLWVLTYLCDECPPSVQKKMKRSTRGQATRVQVEQHAQTGLGVGPVNVSGGAGQAHGLGRN